MPRPTRPATSRVTTRSTSSSSSSGSRSGLGRSGGDRRRPPTAGGRGRPGITGVSAEDIAGATRSGRDQARRDGRRTLTTADRRVGRCRRSCPSTDPLGPDERRAQPDRGRGGAARARRRSSAGRRRRRPQRRPRRPAGDRPGDGSTWAGLPPAPAAPSRPPSRDDRGWFASSGDGPWPRRRRRGRRGHGRDPARVPLAVRDPFRAGPSPDARSCRRSRRPDAAIAGGRPVQSPDDPERAVERHRTPATRRALPAVPAGDRRDAAADARRGRHAARARAPPRRRARALRTCTLKVEGQNPTGSFKDRGMVVAVSKASRRARGRSSARRPATPRHRRRPTARRPASRSSS